MIRKIRAFLAARPSLFGTVSLLYKIARNLAFAVWNLILALVYGSWWYLTAGVWHGLLGGIRTAASFSVKKREEDADTEPDSGKTAGQPFVRTLADRISRIGSGEGGTGLVRASGILLVLLSVVVAGTNVLSIRERIADVKGLIPVIGTAAFTFYKMIFAVVRLARGQRRDLGLDSAGGGEDRVDGTRGGSDVRRGEVADAPRPQQHRRGQGHRARRRIQIAGDGAARRLHRDRCGVLESADTAEAAEGRLPAASEHGAMADG